MEFGAFQAISELLVTSTISQDLSLGRTVEDDLKLATFGHRLISEPETSTVPEPQTTGSPNPGNHALQDYHMQLKLLEQQNKKRPVMARYEQDEVQEQTDNEVQTNQRDVENIMQSTDKGETKAPRASSSRQTRRTREAKQRTDDLDALPTEDAPTGRKGSKRRKKAHIQEDSPNVAEHTINDDTGSCVHQNETPTSAGKLLYVIIYRVSCRTIGVDGMPMYLDTPCRTFSHDYRPHYSQHFHLQGSSKVHNLGQFLTSVGGLAYIIFRDMACDDNMRWVMSPFNDHKVAWKESVAIIDERLRASIDGVARCAPNGSAYHSEPSQMYALRSHNDQERDLYELRFFYHHREALISLLPSLLSPVKEQIQSLWDFFEAGHGTEYHEANKLLSQGLVHRDHLGILFCPNDVIVSRQSDLISAFVLRSWPVGHSVLSLDCWAWGFDGQKLHRKIHSKSVARPLKNVVKIRDLEVYPLRYATDEERRALHRRGQKFWSLRYKNLSTYDGHDFKGEQYYSNESRCMIDYKTYRRFHPQAEAFKFSTTAIAPFDRWPETVAHDATLDESLLILLPPNIHGFFLKDKKWVTLLVDNIRPVTWNKDAYDRLVLPRRTKDLVEALVKVRTSKLGERQGMSITGKGKRDDLIAGKGTGLIMLLHGGPGTGKTLTAESVAEIAEMPLYNVTCGDIGTSADAVEEYLQTVLILGKAWNCVLLLDEADVFLEERSLSDLQRNSLVSVFLRTLEYYDGILVLTSNRVGTFDEAFKSRIQVALHYPNLDRMSRKKIWRNFFDMIEADEEDVNLEELNKHLNELADHDMNGREIRNVLTTARQLALFRNETLGWDHVEQAITTARDFTKYLGSVHGHTDDQYARDQELR